MSKLSPEFLVNCLGKRKAIQIYESSQIQIYNWMV